MTDITELIRADHQWIGRLPAGPAQRPKQPAPAGIKSDTESHRIGKDRRVS
jgi:hypothetical protein